MIPPGGLGDAIGMLSVFLASKKPVEITETDPYVCQQLKDIFQISDQRLIVKKVDQIQNPDCWMTLKSKLFVPYFSCETINVFGQQFKIDRSIRKRRPCIALAAYSAQHMADQLDLHHRVDFPFNRVYSRSDWAKIYEFCMQMNYDVIYVNSTEITLEQKIHMLNELCDAVICAEGGVAHLSHLLRIPCFVLPWHHWIDGSLQSPYLDYATHNLHIDPRTWFLNGVEQLLSWTRSQFDDKIDALYHDQGNNAYLDGTLKIDYQNLCTLAPLHTWLDSCISDQEKEFLRKYIVTVA
jgi:hypothetical protein